MPLASLHLFVGGVAAEAPLGLVVTR
jgi:hypothetical protein